MPNYGELVWSAIIRCWPDQEIGKLATLVPKLVSDVQTNDTTPLTMGYNLRLLGSVMSARSTRPASFLDKSFCYRC